MKYGDVIAESWWNAIWMDSDGFYGINLSLTALFGCTSVDCEGSRVTVSSKIRRCEKLRAALGWWYKLMMFDLPLDTVRCRQYIIRVYDRSAACVTATVSQRYLIWIFAFGGVFTTDDLRDQVSLKNAKWQTWVCFILMSTFHEVQRLHASLNTISMRCTNSCDFYSYWLLSETLIITYCKYNEIQEDLLSIITLYNKIIINETDNSCSECYRQVNDFMCKLPSLLLD